VRAAAFVDDAGIVATTEVVMDPRTRSVLSGLAATALAASVSLAGAAPAAAIGQETFGCRLSPGTAGTYRTLCSNTRASGRYDATFALLDTSGTYVASWAVTGQYQSIVAGCTATSTTCTIALPGSSTDSRAAVTVVYSQDGQTATRYAEAVVYQFCGTAPC
jgi:hypothetical protein